MNFHISIDEELSGSDKLGIGRPLVRDLSASVCCFLEQDTLIIYLVLVQPRKMGKCPDMTEKLLTGT